MSDKKFEALDEMLKQVFGSASERAIEQAAEYARNDAGSALDFLYDTMYWFVRLGKECPNCKREPGSRSKERLLKREAGSSLVFNAGKNYFCACDTCVNLVVCDTTTNTVREPVLEDMQEACSSDAVMFKLLLLYVVTKLYRSNTKLLTERIIKQIAEFLGPYILSQIGDKMVSDDTNWILLVEFYSMQHRVMLASNIDDAEYRKELLEGALEGIETDT